MLGPQLAGSQGAGATRPAVPPGAGAWTRRLGTRPCADCPRAHVSQDLSREIFRTRCRRWPPAGSCRDSVPNRPMACGLQGGFTDVLSPPCPARSGPHSVRVCRRPGPASVEFRAERPGGYGGVLLWLLFSVNILTGRGQSGQRHVASLPRSRVATRGALPTTCFRWFVYFSRSPGSGENPRTVGTLLAGGLCRGYRHDNSDEHADRGNGSLSTLENA